MTPKTTIDQALALFRGGQIAAAEQALAQARIFWPGEAEIIRLQAWIRWRVRDFSAALELFDATLRVAPTSALAWLHRGAVLFEMERFEEALASFDASLAQDPNRAETWFNKARALTRLQRLAEAVLAFDHGLLITEDAESLFQRGLALHALGREEEALASYERVRAIKGFDPEAETERAAAMHALGREEEALALFDEVMRRAPSLEAARRKRARALYNMSMQRLTDGVFTEGFELYEHRHAAGAIEGGDLPSDATAWRGQRLEGLLRIWTEQGVGDIIAFARLLPMAHRLTPRIAVAGDPRLAPLLSRSMPFLEFVGAEAPAEQAEAQISMVSLGKFAAPSDLVAFPPYLRADGERAARLRAKYLAQAAGRPIIGVSWFSKNRDIGDAKSARLAEWAVLLRRDCLFINLQYGDTSADIAVAQDAFGCEIITDPEIDQWTDLDSFAAQVDATDAVVSVSCSTVHMAGALGKTCFVLTPEPRGLLWFWGRRGERTNWYDSVRAVRHISGEGWEGQIGRAAASLEAYLARSRAISS